MRRIEGVVLLSFLTGIGSAIVGLIVVVISVTVVALALLSAHAAEHSETTSR